MPVTDNYGVAKLWANRTPGSARSHNGNFSYDGKRLFSYFTVIAVMHERGATDVPVALVTDQTYSVTTSGKHMNPMWSCLTRAGVKSIIVPVLDPENERCHLRNLHYLLDTYDKALLSIQSVPATKTIEKYAEGRVYEAIADALVYHAYFRLKADHAPRRNPAWDIDRAYAMWDDRRRVYNDPKAVASRERAAGRRLLKKLLEV